MQVRGGEERLGTCPSFTTGTASVRMHEDGRQSEKGIGPEEWRCRKCDDAEWFNAGPILFSWASVSSRKAFDHRIINAKNTRTTVVVKVGTMTASDGGRMTYRHLSLDVSSR